MAEQKRKNRCNIEVEVKKKIDCEEKAFRWVEHLALLDNISEEELAKVISQIMVCHYNDITEERAISKVCGYPLCNIKLGKRSPHKYSISTKHNKVIDLSVRENFCSLYCFQASKFIENQIPEDPIWLRDGKPLDLKLLEKKSPKKELGIGEVLLPISKLNIDDDKDLSGACSADENDEKYLGTPHQTTNDNDLFQDNDDELESKNTQLPKKSHEYKQIKLIDNKEIIKHDDTKGPRYITKITSLLKEWFTKKSFKHLNSLSDEFHDSDDDDDDADDGDDDSDTDYEKEHCANPLANSAKFQNKVINFLSRQPEWISESNADKMNEGEKVYKKKAKHALPSIDSKSQNSIRRRIVHEKLNCSLREILPTCGLLEEDLTQVGFFNLIDTFNFTSKNIVLNLKEWMVTTFSLLKIISKTYQKDFGCMKKRYNDINEFLIMRSLPNVLQIEDIVQATLENMKTNDAKLSINKVEDQRNVCLVNENDSSYYNDNMEEVD